ncbi:nucleotide sugar dehydrogenase [Nemania sp. NC0429]|nr:nucleotide sugar dehydrogenase [Nemania sp. NC0429]
MEPTPSPAGGSDESTYRDIVSSAPTTPEYPPNPNLVLHPEQSADDSDHVPADLAVSSSRVARSRNGTLSARLEAARGRVRNICFIGAGYVGGPTAAVMAYHNPQIRVTVVDRDTARIRRWNSRHLPIYEPELRPIVRIARDGGRAFAFSNSAGSGSDADADTWDMSTSISSEGGCGLVRCDGQEQAQVQEQVAETKEVPARAPNLFFCSAEGEGEARRCIAEADVVFIAVNTPTKACGVGAGCAMDLTAFEAAAREVVRHARAGAVIVEKSTVPCRTAELVREMIAVHRPGARFEILSNPEFLAAGTAVHDLLHPDRVLIGSSKTPSGGRAAGALADLYAAWVPRARIITVGTWSSELSKLVANAMLAQRVSSINSVSAICEATGAEIDEVATAIGSDARIGDRFLKAGVGFGGSCFKKDVLSLVYLAESLGLGDVAEYWRQVVTMNEHQRDRFSRRVVRCLNNTLVGKKVAFLGFGFKANTSDMRESPTLGIIRTLLDERPREMAVFDPRCDPAVVRREIDAMLRTRSQKTGDGEGGGDERSVVVVYSDVYEACAGSHAVLITTECDEFRNAKCPPVSPFTDRYNKPGEHVDPRPFARSKPSETDILALHKFLLLESPPVPMPAREEEDPLQRYQAEPCCAEDCAECEFASASQEGDGGHRHPAGEMVDWHRISYHMETPKWLFDGKGVVDAEAMAKLGVRVERVGYRGWA